MVQALSEDLVLVVKLTVTEAPHQNIQIQNSLDHKKRTRRSFEKIVCNLFKPEEVK
jgi:hypothetical protein